MVDISLGSWTGSFLSMQPGQESIFRNNYQPWLSSESRPDVTCELDSTFKVDTPAPSNLSRFICEQDGPVIRLTRGILRVITDTGPEVWHCKANLGQHVSWLKSSEQGSSVPEKDYFLFSMNLIMRALSTVRNSLNGSICIHASAVGCTDGGCYLFSGPMDSGKSTAAMCCRDLELVSEDTVEVRTPADTDPECFSTPLNNIEKKGGRPFNGKANGIFFVSKSREISLQRLDAPTAARHIYTNAMMDCIVPFREEDFLETVCRVSEKTPCFMLGFPENCTLTSALEDAVSAALQERGGIEQ